MDSYIHSGRHYKYVFPGEVVIPFEIRATIQILDVCSREIVCTLKDDEECYRMLKQEMNSFYSGTPIARVEPRVRKRF